MADKPNATRNIVLLMHVSLDGFVAGPNGEMDWIHTDEELFDYGAEFTANADTALYGRVTYQMMEGYWPTAAENPNATRHDIEHARWVNQAPKIVFSRTLKTVSWNNTRIISDNIPEEMAKLKAQPGKNLLMIGSARTAHTFMRLGLIDEYYINVNPVVLGSGIPLFTNLADRIKLRLLGARTFASGVVGLHYARD